MWYLYMGQNCWLPMKNLGKSVQDRNLPYPFLRGQPLNCRNAIAFTLITHTYTSPTWVAGWIIRWFHLRLRNKKGVQGTVTYANIFESFALTCNRIRFILITRPDLGGRQIVVTGVGLGCSLSVLREGWKVICAKIVGLQRCDPVL